MSTRGLPADLHARIEQDCRTLLEIECDNCGDSVQGFDVSPVDTDICIYCCPEWSNWDSELSEAVDELRAALWAPLVRNLAYDAGNNRRGAILAQRAKLAARDAPSESQLARPGSVGMVSTGRSNAKPHAKGGA